jgi:CRP-like cAMP-binding protein
VEDKSFCSYEKGELILEQGKITDFILYVEMGNAKIVHTNSKGQSYTFLHVKKGDYLGIHPLLNKEKSHVSVVVTQSLSGYKISENALNSAIENKPEVSLELIKHLCSKIGSIEAKTSKISQKNIKANVAETLLFNKIKRDISGPYTAQELANMVGATRNYIYKILRELKQTNAITIKNKKVQIIDESKLAKLANE